MAEETYRVVGGLDVAGVPNGETVTLAALLEYDPLVNVSALVAGNHLELVTSGAETPAKTKKTGD
jgi:hypothetical protein